MARYAVYCRNDELTALEIQPHWTIRDLRRELPPKIKWFAAEDVADGTRAIERAIDAGFFDEAALDRVFDRYRRLYDRAAYLISYPHATVADIAPVVAAIAPIRSQLGWAIGFDIDADEVLELLADRLSELARQSVKGIDPGFFRELED